MSIAQHSEVEAGDGIKRVDAVLLRTSVNKKGEISDEMSPYSPSEETIKVRSMILKHFILGTTNMYTPRVEFNDLSLTERDQEDQMAFNTYQPNNGEAWEGSSQASAWRSRALRPIVRNKCMSIAAHATARLIFPKVFAYNSNSDQQEDAARLIEDLMEWSGDISNYPYTALMRVITAMSSPASIGYTEYGEVMKTVKTEKDDDGKWIEKRVRDESYPCFMDEVVPVTQFYIQNIFESDIQKQGWLIWRKVYSFSEAEVKYGQFDDFKYVRPGVQTLCDDANNTFYYVYDPNMRQEDVEEIMYWNKNLDLKIIMINGVMMTEHDNPNPRADKLYPFDKFFYEPINNRFFYGKSLSFKLQHDSDIINTLYQMVIDGTYLSIFKPMINVGGEIIASDVIVPGSVTTFSDPNSDLRAINVGSDLRSGLETLSVVERSINESSQEPLQQGQSQSGTQTAYEISKLEQNANTILGLFLQMIAKHVKDFGKLRLGDILQYLTLSEVSDITGEPELTYKTFFLKGLDKQSKISFDGDLQTEYEDKEEYLNASYDVLDEEKEKKMTITKANPILIRELQYLVTISPDVINPRSEDLERAYDLEAYDRMVNNPMTDQEEVLRLLLHANKSTKTDPDKYIAKQPVQPQPILGPNGQNLPAEKGPAVQSGNSPLKSVMGKSNAPVSLVR